MTFSTTCIGTIVDFIDRKPTLSERRPNYCFNLGGKQRRHDGPSFVRIQQSPTR
ncbi:hypothetical protein MOBUDSM44075_04677 [Mycolicibacterium obuense]|uniref:Uncharacterized protein n=1 Tax=Mycolicibacterium obuense TaxID=1807 RepID=A0A0J6VI34_9MYCO|nr:hypothetical protein MOBUDSM44075_04677 [Mycolicibacterium obuense]